MCFPDVTILRRDPPGTPSDRLTFERFDGSYHPEPGFHLFLDIRDPHLISGKGAAPLKIATAIYRALDKMIRELVLSELLWNFQFEHQKCSSITFSYEFLLSDALFWLFMSF